MTTTLKEKIEDLRRLIHQIFNEDLFSVGYVFEGIHQTPASAVKDIYEYRYVNKQKNIVFAIAYQPFNVSKNVIDFVAAEFFMIDKSRERIDVVKVLRSRFPEMDRIESEQYHYIPKNGHPDFKNNAETLLEKNRDFIKEHMWEVLTGNAWIDNASVELTSEDWDMIYDTYKRNEGKKLS